MEIYKYDSQASLPESRYRLLGQRNICVVPGGWCILPWLISTAVSSIQLVIKKNRSLPRYLNTEVVSSYLLTSINIIIFQDHLLGLYSTLTIQPKWCIHIAKTMLAIWILRWICNCVLISHILYVLSDCLNVSFQFKNKVIAIEYHSVLTGTLKLQHALLNILFMCLLLSISFSVNTNCYFVRLQHQHQSETSLVHQF